VTRKKKVSPKDYLKDDDKEKVKYARRKLKKFIKIYNALCDSCKRMIFKNPRRELKEFCKTCQDKARDIFDS
jgi:hypothetical protein